MRFKIGDKVEVMNNKEAPFSWLTAKVLSVSGHKYLVQYDFNHGTSSNRIVEMVLRKFVRPCPPLVEGVGSYNAGDIVEVFYQYSWKVGAILDIFGGKKENKRNRNHMQASALQKQYLVRLLGCSQDLVFGSSNIRMRQTWRDDKWILMGKSSQSGDDVIATKPSTSNRFQKTNFQVPRYNARSSNQPKKNITTIQDNVEVCESPKFQKRTKPCYGLSIFEAHNRRAKKLRAIAKVEKNMHDSFNMISNGYNEREKHVLGNSAVRCSELNSSDSDACSVGSCSITSQCLRNPYIRSIPIHCQGTDAPGSDAESFYGSGPERKSKEELEVSIRELELHAYRATLGALYASGPLSWEQETMLTNLRIMLHISNDEHLNELKHLISTKNAFSVKIGV